MESLLEREQFKETHKEFVAFDCEPHRYQLLGGPANTRELANHLERTAWYEVLYQR